jgi:hypothetical protein
MTLFRTRARQSPCRRDAGFPATRVEPRPVPGSPAIGALLAGRRAWFRRGAKIAWRIFATVAPAVICPRWQIIASASLFSGAFWLLGGKLLQRLGTK